MKNAVCLCGKVSIQVTDFQPEVGACHCSMCRKWGSGPLLTIEAGTSADITIHNEAFVSRYQSSEWAERGFCSNCGSNLFYHLLPTDAYSIPIDLFEEQAEAALSLEVYYDQKPAYYDFANPTKKLTEAAILKMVQETYFSPNE
ncbi:GFA family protein [Enterococcus pseudoavium]|uniref:GFA family protein n=1 Tax=Enterococcus pseudoavium TaxID=44007 RepID=A0AAE4HXG1_9ENTE|nr:GFA family protein [Enterococcus pseudoavium]MDT2735790.1 GFA family protein [Enterococcus pseudoavium]